MNSKKGFSLVELVVTIAIISILITILLIVINPVTVIQQTEDTKRRTELNQLKTALQLHFNDNNNYPGALGVLVPTYTRALPETMALGTLHYGTTGGDYDASVELDQPSADDAATATRCAAIIGGGGGGDFFICPD